MSTKFAVDEKNIACWQKMQRNRYESNM